MAVKKGNEVATIDVAMVTVKPKGSEDELVLTTATEIGLSVQSETTDAVKLIVKGRLIAQKREKVTVTGNTITMTDNVFNAELVKTLQGGVIKYWKTVEQNEESDTDMGFGVASYTPPVAGSTEAVPEFETNVYTSIYDAAGLITGYEKCTYPNCTGVPVSFSAKDDEFRAPEYTINSAPKNGEAPYKISYVKALPEVSE